jgi:hypothetical protein
MAGLAVDVVPVLNIDGDFGPDYQCDKIALVAIRHYCVEEA